MSLEKIDSLPNKITPPFSNGDFIRDGQGRTGKIIGQKEINGVELVQVQFAEHTGYVPATRLGQDLTVIPRRDMEKPQEKPTTEFLQDREKERQNKYLLFFCSPKSLYPHPTLPIPRSTGML